VILAGGTRRVGREATPTERSHNTELTRGLGERKDLAPTVTTSSPLQPGDLATTTTLSDPKEGPLWPRGRLTLLTVEHGRGTPTQACANPQLRERHARSYADVLTRTTARGQ
jgi:hypothetical protein